MDPEILSPIVIPDEDEPQGAPSFMFSVSSLSPSQFSDVTNCSTFNHPFSESRGGHLSTSAISQADELCNHESSPVLVNVDAILTPDAAAMPTPSDMPTHQTTLTQAVRTPYSGMRVRNVKVFSSPLFSDEEGEGGDDSGLSKTDLSIEQSKEISGDVPTTMLVGSVASSSSLEKSVGSEEGERVLSKSMVLVSRHLVFDEDDQALDIEQDDQNDEASCAEEESMNVVNTADIGSAICQDYHAMAVQCGRYLVLLLAIAIVCRYVAEYAGFTDFLSMSHETFEEPVDSSLSEMAYDAATLSSLDTPDDIVVLLPSSPTSSVLVKHIPHHFHTSLLLATFTSGMMRQLLQVFSKVKGVVHRKGQRIMRGLQSVWSRMVKI